MSNKILFPHFLTYRPIVVIAGMYCALSRSNFTIQYVSFSGLKLFFSEKLCYEKTFTDMSSCMIRKRFNNEQK